MHTQQQQQQHARRESCGGGGGGVRVCRQQEPRLCIERERERIDRHRSMSVCLSVCDVEHIYIYIYIYIYVKQQQTNANTLVCVAGWLACWLGVGYRPPPAPSQTKSQAKQATHTKWNSTLPPHSLCVCATNQRWVPG